MTDTGIDKRARIARDELVASGIDPDTILPSTGFTSVAELGQAYQDKSISLGANYNDNMWKFLATVGEKRLALWLTVTPWLLALIGFGLAYAQSNRILAFGAVGILIANSLAKRYPEIGNAIGGIGLTIIVVTAFMGKWMLTGVLISLVIASFCARARSGWYSEIIVNRALQADSIFALLFVTDNINVRNNTTGQRVYYQRH